MLEISARRGARWWLAGVVALGACRSDARAPKPPPEPPVTPDATPPVAPSDPGKAAGAPRDDAPLGVPSLDALAWRGRGGQGDFTAARAAERRGDWAAMVAACEAALRADPSHLEAAWLLSAGLAHLGRLAEVGAPLARAVAGDPVKWGAPALQLPFFDAFWKSASGAALRPWVAAALARWPRALERGLVVLVKRRLLVHDVDTGRWLPLSRHARVRGALTSATRVLYVARAPGAGEPVLGVIDRKDGRLEELPLPTGGVELAVAEPAPARAGVDAARVLVRAERGGWTELADGALRATRARPPHGAPRLRLAGDQVRIERPPVAGVVADWDQAGMASALRVRRSNRLIAAPAPALIDGQRAAWSPAGERLALVTAVEDCDAEAAGPRYAAYVAEPITGALTELARADVGLDVQWVDARRLALASERGVELVDLAADTVPPALRLVAAEASLAAPLRASPCAAPSTPAPEPEPED